ncbi:hypothetical protein BLOT_009086 [Blomia tropicalis]|nr:hypothetical protein BLOT_009086 [Blomia tropicalis]
MNLKVLEEKYLDLIDSLDSFYGEKYNKLTEQLERTCYLFEHKRNTFKSFGDFLLSQCIHYELAHQKSMQIAQTQLMSVTTSFLNINSLGKVSEDEYKQLIHDSNQALLNMPFDWNNWPLMSSIMELYLDRAIFHYNQEKFKRANSDLRHVSSIIFNFSDTKLVNNYFKFKNTSLLPKILNYKVNLLCILKCDNEWKEFTSYQSTDQEIDSMFEMIRKIDTIFNNDKQKIWTDLNNKNYRLSYKIKLNETKNGGRCFVATAPIEPNEPVILERAQTTVTLNEMFQSYCDHCHQPIDTFWPCSGCTELCYCSFQCSSQAMKHYHHNECGIFGLISIKGNYTISHMFRMFSIFGFENIINCEKKQLKVERKLEFPFTVNHYLNSTSMQTIPMESFTESKRKFLYRSICTLMNHRGNHENYRESSVTANSWCLVQFLIYKKVISPSIIYQVDLLCNLMEHIATGLSRITTNGFTWWSNVTEDQIGNCFFMLSSLINHSCNPNINWNIHDGGFISLVSKRAIQPGEQLTDCYGPKRFTPFNERQSRLTYNYCFNCQCMVCMKDVSNDPVTLRCLTPGINCDGPLVLGERLNCLQCGQKPWNRSIKDIELLHNVLKRTSTSFIDLMKKFQHGNRKLSNWYTKWIQLRKVEEIRFNLYKPLVRKQITQSRLHKLEYYFNIYSMLIYGCNYNLLEKCALMLMVYDEMKLYHRAFALIPLVDNCMKHIYPEMTDKELENTKLIDILQYDMKSVGDFFPIIHYNYDRLKETVQDRMEHIDETRFPLEVNEFNYYQLYIDTKKRLVSIVNDKKQSTLNSKQLSLTFSATEAINIIVVI